MSSARLLLTLLLGAALAGLASLGGCGPEDGGPSTAAYTRSSVPKILASTPVMVAFATQIAGDAGVVVPFIPDGEDAATWTPTPEAIRDLQRSDRVILQGAAYEEWADRISLPSQRTVKTADAVRAAWIRYRVVRSHSHGDGDVHEHDGVDGHTWMDPALAQRQAAKIHASLVRGWPEHKATYDAGFAALTKDLEALGARLDALPALPEGTHLHASQPVYGYLAARMGWTLKEHDLDATAAVDDFLIEPLKLALNQAPSKVMLWHTTPTDALAEGLAKRLGLSSLTLDACVRPNEASTILARMQGNLDRLERWLR